MHAWEVLGAVRTRGVTNGAAAVTVRHSLEDGARNVVCARSNEAPAATKDVWGSRWMVFYSHLYTVSSEVKRHNSWYGMRQLGGKETHRWVRAVKSATTGTQSQRERPLGVRCSRAPLAEEDERTQVMALVI